MTSEFTWIPFYKELADDLCKWQEKQSELIAFLEELRSQGLTISSLMDKSEEGENFLLNEIDPFTFYGVFNRGITDENRIAILYRVKDKFQLNSDVPSNFSGIPVLNNMKSWFFGYKKDRGIRDVEKLWNVFLLSLQDNPIENANFLSAFDDALSVKHTNFNLTMGLFWIRPEIFLNLDQKNRTYLKIDMPSEGLSSQFYKQTINNAKKLNKPFYELSLDAWLSSGQNFAAPIPVQKTSKDNVDYWLVGAYWENQIPADRTDQFISEGIWVNGYKDKFLDVVKSMKVGDKIGIKAATTQRNDLPFDNRNKTIARLIIKARGTIVANRGDGRTIEVEWEPEFQEKNWYFYAARKTVWHVLPKDKKVWKEAAGKLIDFVWYDKDQDYDWFIQQWWDSGEEIQIDDETSNLPFSTENMVANGVFIALEELDHIIKRLSDKKAIILQGPPGVGKTFISKQLAYALMNEIDPERVEFVQFHQSYSYDDFVRGYRPLPEKNGAFGIKDGIFLEFCQKAIDNPDKEYVFIIDEINRGNLSQIFGELLMLIEHDKRGEEFCVPLTYRTVENPRNYIPSNLYLIGLMNLADRSLAMVDYALRRRFAFINLVPQYNAESFRKWLSDRMMKPDLLQMIIGNMDRLNHQIKEDPLLGENYLIGHSYFCPKDGDLSELDVDWYRSIVQTEIIPLIKEYWFDNPQEIEKATRIFF